MHTGGEVLIGGDPGQQGVQLRTFAPHNVRVNAIALGAVLTDRLTQMPAHVRDGVAP